VALHDRVLVARGGRTVDRWPVVARARRLNF
jgi:D-serine deaminase-like pyridoxal phosphate-dependent protein